MNDEELRKLARRRLKAKADFKNFLFIWLLVSVLLTGIWFVTDAGGYFWPAWAIAGMGIAAFFMAIDAYGPNRGFIAEERIDEEIRRMTGGTRT
jgi:Na+/H+-translocating membrane pyrophosphatase